MIRPRVLVVEDRPSVLKLMATILERGYEVLTAGDGATALALAESEPVDVVLTDIRMPGASGFELLRAIQARAPRTSVVMMTAYANVPDAVAAMKLGAYDYVAKPLDADEIALVVARAVDDQRTGGGAPGRPGGPAGPQGGIGDPGPDVSLGFRRAVGEARDRASRQYLERLLRHFRGNVTCASNQAGMTRESLHRVLRRYGIHSEQFKGSADPGDAGRGAGWPVADEERPS